MSRRSPSPLSILRGVASARSALLAAILAAAPVAGPIAVPAAALAVVPSAVRADVVEVDRAALAGLLEGGATIVDVRREDEWRERGLLEGSHPLTFFDAKGRYDVDAWLAALGKIVSPDETVVLVCAHGVRSRRIADLLDSRLGFTAVHNVTDGIEGWRKGGGEVVPYAP